MFVLAVKAETENQVEAEDQAAPGVEKYLNQSGPYFGFGLKIGRQRNSCDENRDFSGARTKVKSTPFGMAIIYGYTCKVLGNFSFGVEAAVDLGQNGKKQGVGNVFSQDSLAFHDIAGNVNTLFNNIGANLSTAAAAAVGGGAPAVDNNVFRKIVDVLKYIGGSDTVLLDDAFVNGPANAGLLFNAGAGVVNPAATLSNFSVGAAGEILDAFGTTNRNAIDLVREFVTGYYPELAAHLRSLHDNGIVDLPIGVAEALADFFTDFDIGGYNAALLSMATTASMADIHAARDALKNYEHNISSNVDNKNISFGVCPSFAFKFGYYVAEADAIVSLKFGAAYVSGKASFGPKIGTKNFGALTPKISIEFRKKIYEDWNIGVEVSHVIQTTKRFATIKVLRRSIEPNVKITRTEFTVSATRYIRGW
jgi:hypothetical protein